MKRSSVDGRSVLGVALCLAACAEDVPGAPPTEGQLAFPIGIAASRAEGSPALDRVLVASSNFDQRYNAGTISALSVDQLFSVVASASLTSPDGEVPVVSSVSVPTFGGELLFVPGGTGPGDGRLFIASRGRNVVTMARLQGGNLSCSSGKVDPEPGLACTPAFILDTGSTDPYALESLPALGTAGSVAVGHLDPFLDRSIDPEAPPAFGVIAVVDLAALDRQIAEEGGASSGVSPISTLRFEGIAGITGLAATSTGTLLVASRDATAATASQLVSIAVGGSSLRTEMGLSFGAALRATGMRGLAVARPAGGRPARAYVSVRLPERQDATGRGPVLFNAAIAVVGVAERGGEGGQLDLISVTEVGEEIGRPVVLERSGATSGPSRLVYVGDIRDDRIWILDASTDVLRVVGSITGRVDRPGDGEVERVRLLDGPAEIVFFERSGTTLGFVTNFANSTLAVIDVSSPDPREHKIKARLGAAKNLGRAGEDEF